MSKPRILIIENSIDVTGALKSITKAAFDLKADYDFQFVVPSGSRGKYLLRERGFQPIHELPMKEISRRFLSMILYLPYLIVNTIRLKKIIRRNQISIIHVNDLYNLLPVMLHLSGTKIPYVCHIRFLPDRFPPWLFNFWLRLHFRYASRIVAVSHSVSKMLPEHPKFVVIHNELPIEERFPDYSNTSKANETFLYLSNFMDGKGQNFALKAFAKVHEQLPSWKLRFVGGDMGLQKNKTYRSQLQQLAKSLGIAEKIEWSEFTEVVEIEYKLADIVLNFSESESFSITCVEALFFGKPLIATDCGGPAEIIDHGESGILVENRNLNAMSEAMLLLAQNKELRDKFSIEGKKRSRNRFSIERTSYRLRDIYNSIR